MEWEYLHEGCINADNLEDALDILGKASWELVALHRYIETVPGTARSGQYDAVFYAFTMKRPRVEGRRKR